MKKGSRHFYRRLLLVYTAILVGEVVLLVLYFISELRQQARETNLEYMEMEGTEGRDGRNPGLCCSLLLPGTEHSQDAP